MPMFHVIRANDKAIVQELDNQTDAVFAASNLSNATGVPHYAKQAPDLFWREREQQRFACGDYESVVWGLESWWRGRSDELLEHFTHKSSEKPEMVAFTESAEKGEQDRQTRMRAGAYLQKYFSDELSETEIAHWARVAARIDSSDAVALQIASTPEHIKEVYINGPESCMSCETEHYLSRPIHPVEVYGDSDLAVAYIERKADFHKNSISARVMVWPDQKTYGRVYPTPERYNGDCREAAKREHDALIKALESVGYSHGSFEGAKIRAVETRRDTDEFVMPYIDNHYALERDGDFFTLSRHGTYGAQNTHGTISLSDRFTCDCCESHCDEDDLNSVIASYNNTESWCEHCVSNRAYYCNGYDEYYSEDSYESVEVYGETYSLRFVERNFIGCERTAEWFSPEDIYQVNTSNGTESWCEDEKDSFSFFCNSTDQYYSDDFESVEIDGETYEREAALVDSVLSAKLAEMESETETEDAE